MSIQEILTTSPSTLDSDSILRQKARSTAAVDQTELEHLVQDLIDTMESNDITIGLAAPQIGVDLAVAVIDREMVGDDEHLVIIDPESPEQTGKKVTKRESCMSLPPWGGDVEMRKNLNVSFTNHAGERVSRVFEGFAARVVRHEIDHLNGVLYVDHVEDLETLIELDIFD